jgi:TP901 family phage tail tape measure protein
MAEIKGITIVIDGETTKLDKALREINKNAAAVGRELTSVSRLLKMSPGNTTLITQKQKMLSDAVSTTSKKLEDLKDAQKQLDAKGVDENSKEYRKLQREIAYTDTKLEALKKEQIAFTAENSKLGQMSQKYKDIGDKMTTVGKKLSQTLSVAAGAGMALAVKSAVDYETAWTGVTKTVDGTRTQLAKIKQGILDLSQKTASSAVDIAAVAENAGQLGIKTKDILSFTKTMVMLGDTTNLSADEASSALAKFANVTGMSASKYKNLGSAIVDLGNNFATTEADIVAMSTRLASTGSLAGLSQPQILALAAAMSSVGIEAEAGGSAMSKLLKQIQLSTELGGKKLSQFASVAGVSGNQFKKIFEKDAVRALGLFIDGLNDTDRNGKSAIAILDDMGIKEVRLSNTILALANSNGLMTKAVNTSTKAWGENTALQAEAEKRYATTAAKLNQTKEAAREVGIMFGEVILPPLAKMAEGFKNLLGKLSQTNPALKAVVVVLTLMAAAIGPLLMALGSMARGLSVVTKAWSLHKAAVDLGRKATIKATVTAKANAVATKVQSLAIKAQAIAVKGATIAQRVFNLAMKANPILLVASAIGTLVGALSFFAVKSGNVDKYFDNLSKKIETFANNLPGIISKIADKAPQIIESLINGIVRNLPALIESAVKMIEALINGLVKAAPQIVKATPRIILALVKGILQLAGSVISAGAKLIGYIVKGIGSKLSDIVTWAKKIPARIISGVKSVWGRIKQLGADLVAGIWNGITGKFKWLTDKIKSFATNVKDKLKKFFGIKSPSKVTAEIGRYLTEGLGLGIEDAGKFAIKKALGVAGSVVDAMAVSVPAAQMQAAKAGSILSRPQPSIGDDVASAVGTTLAMAGSSPQQINITVELGGTKVGEKIVKLYDQTKRAVGK